MKVPWRTGSRTTNGRLLAFLVLAAAVSLLWSCQTIPIQGTKGPPESAGALTKAAPQAALTAYVNRHDIAIQFPSEWHLQDAMVTYGDLAAAAEEGASYLQLYSYDPRKAADPSAPVPAADVKIAIMLEPAHRGGDDSRLVAALGDRLVEKSSFPINGHPAVKVHYRIQSEESTGTLDVLAVIYLDQDLLVRFICYPWNSRLEREFETVVRSFRYKGK